MHGINILKQTGHMFCAAECSSGWDCLIVALRFDSGYSCWQEYYISDVDVASSMQHWKRAVDCPITGDVSFDYFINVVSPDVSPVKVPFCPL